MTRLPRSYEARWQGYRFRLDPDNVAALRSLPDFDGREEPAVAEDFLRASAERWAEALVAAGAPPGDFDVALDGHQRRTHLSRDGVRVFTAEL
ncbi:MAG: hypothetical protein ABI592_14145 [Acidobacteriota bacterium]